VKCGEAEDPKNFARWLRFGVLEEKVMRSQEMEMGERVREGEGKWAEGNMERRWRMLVTGSGISLYTKGKVLILAFLILHTTINLFE
jgi:hypothetical protein